MKLTFTLVADCDPPPSESSAETLAERLDDCASEIEDVVAGLLLELHAGFSIDANWKVEP